MTTKQEYAEAAEWVRKAGWFYHEEKHGELAHRIMRALAEGAVLCEKAEAAEDGMYDYRPIEEQPK